MTLPIGLLERADEDEVCEDCASTENLTTYDGWLTLCRTCAGREVAPDQASQTMYGNSVPFQWPSGP